MFECAPEIRTDHLTPDGLLARVRGAGSLDDLPDSWPRLEWVVVLEGKTEKDHQDELALARAELATWIDDPTAK